MMVIYIVGVEIITKMMMMISDVVYWNDITIVDELVYILVVVFVCICLLHSIVVVHWNVETTYYSYNNDNSV